MQLDDSTDGHVAARITQLMTECQNLQNGTYKGVGPAMQRALAGGNLEQALATTAKLDQAFWRGIMVGPVPPCPQPHKLRHIVIMNAYILDKRVHCRCTGMLWQ